MLANAGAESTSPVASLFVLLLQAGEGKTSAEQDFEEQVASLSSEEKEKVSRIHSMCVKCFPFIMCVQLQRLLQLLLVGELFFSKPRRSEIAFSARSLSFSTMGNLQRIYMGCSVFSIMPVKEGGIWEMLARVICLPY